MGTYTVTASFTGIVTQKNTVTVTVGETSSVSFTLVKDNQQLQEVVISGENWLMNKETDYVVRMLLKNLENPQVC